MSFFFIFHFSSNVYHVLDKMLRKLLHFPPIKIVICINLSSYLKIYDISDAQPFSSYHTSSSVFREYSSKNGVSQTNRTVRHDGGVVKLLLRCLQSIQCQYYLVFGVVKTVPLCNLSRDCDASLPSLFSSPRLQKKCFRNILFTSQTAQQHGERSSIHIYIDIYCICSVYVVPLLLTLCVRARVSP